MTVSLDDTIAAVSSAPGGAARGIVRLSGPQVTSCLGTNFHPLAETDLITLGAPQVVEGIFRLPGGAELPAELYLWPGQRSYTRQPVAELHTFGSPPLLDAVLRAVCAAGARLAEPGEFTLRAFLAGQLDLTQAEAVLGVIDARSDAQLQTALAQLAGGLSSPLAALREQLLDLLAHLEAGLDFVEEDIEFIATHQLQSQLADAEQLVRRLTRQMESRGESATRLRVVLVGAPNAGKSSLFNVLAGDASALVSDSPGTTRDYLTARVELAGLDCELIDTAGAEPAKVEHSLAAAAQAMTRQQHQQAQVRLLCLDASRPLTAWEQDQLAAPESQLVVLTKTDLPRRTDLLQRAVETSSRTGHGLDELRAAIAAFAAAQEETGVVAGTAARCGESLRLAADTLATACALAEADSGEELVAAEIRFALEQLGKVVGAVYTDDVLDRIFSRFCIGK